MQTDDEPRLVASRPHGKGAQRRRRLRRGVARWDFDRQLCAEPTIRVARVTLTMADEGFDNYKGRVYEFLAKMRRTWPGVRYFCWLELNKGDRVHYNLIWVNPPHRRNRDLLKWVDDAWGRGRTQVRFSSGRYSIEQAVEYAVSHSKKMGKKRFQHAFERVPSSLRTFMSQRLEIPPEECDKHLGGAAWGWMPQRAVPLNDGTGYMRWFDEALVYLGERDHTIPDGGYCSALDHRRPKRGPPGARGAAGGDRRRTVGYTSKGEGVCRSA